MATKIDNYSKIITKVTVVRIIIIAQFIEECEVTWNRVKEKKRKEETTERENICNKIFYIYIFQTNLSKPVPHEEE